MKEIKERRMLCISGKDAADFQEKMNLALDGIDAPEITFPAIPYTAYVLYTLHRSEPETIREEYEMSGDGCRCAECPYFERTNDMRRKWHICTYHQKKTRVDSWACEEFYQQVEDGIIEPKGRR